MGLIYKLKFPNGKIYIGQTSCSINIRLQKHKTAAFNKKAKEYNYPLYRAIRKYGWENVISEIIVDNVTYEDLTNLEVKYQKQFNTTNKKLGYNLIFGSQAGRNFKHTEDTKNKIKLKRKLNDHWKGKHHSEESKQKIKMSNRGKTRTQLTKDKISKAKLGVALSEQHKNLLRKPNLKNRKRIASYDLNDNLVKVYASLSEAENDGYNLSHISACANFKRLTHKKLIWRFYND